MSKLQKHQPAPLKPPAPPRRFEMAVSPPPWLRAYTSPPVDESLTRAELVTGLRLVFQRTRIETATTTHAAGDEHLLMVAAVLRDVAAQFGLSQSEVEDIVAEFAERVGR